MTTTYSTSEAIRLTGCGAKRLHVWAQSGVVPPAQGARGTGTRRRFSFADLVALRLLVRLRNNGFPLALVAPFASHVQGMQLRQTADTSRPVLLAYDGDGVRRVPAGGRLSLRERPFAIVVRIDEVLAELQALLHAGSHARARARGFPKGARAGR